MKSYKQNYNDNVYRLGVDTTLLMSWGKTFGPINLKEFFDSPAAEEYEGKKRIFLSLMLEGKLKFVVSPIVLQELNGIARNNLDQTPKAYRRQIAALCAINLIHENPDFFELIRMPKEEYAEFKKDAQELAKIYCNKQPRKIMSPYLKFNERDDLPVRNPQNLPYNLLENNTDMPYNITALTLAQYALLNLTTLTHNREITKRVLIGSDGKHYTSSFGHQLYKINKKLLDHSCSTYSVPQLLRYLEKTWGLDEEYYDKVGYVNENRRQYLKDVKEIQERKASQATTCEPTL